MATVNTGSPYYATAVAAAQNNGVPVNFFTQLIQDESSFNPGSINPYVTSSGNPEGIAQITTGTGKTLGVNPLDPTASLNAAASYLQTLYQKAGSWLGAAKLYGTTTGQGASNIPNLTAALAQDAAGGGPLASGISSAISTITNPVGAAASAIGIPTGLFTLNTAERTIAIVIAVILIGIAMVFLLGQTKTGSTVIETVKSTAATAATAAVAA